MIESKLNARNCNRGELFRPCWVSSAWYSKLWSNQLVDWYPYTRFGFQFGLYHVVALLSFLRSNQLCIIVCYPELDTDTTCTCQMPSTSGVPVKMTTWQGSATISRESVRHVETGAAVVQSSMDEIKCTFIAGEGGGKKRRGIPSLKQSLKFSSACKWLWKLPVSHPLSLHPLKSLQTFYFEFNLTFNGLKNEKYAKL